MGLDGTARHRGGAGHRHVDGHRERHRRRRIVEGPQCGGTAGNSILGRIANVGRVSWIAGTVDTGARIALSSNTTDDAPGRAAHTRKV